MADIAARLHHGTSRELPAERQPRDGQLEAPAVATFHHRDRSLLRLVHANARSRRVTQHCELQFQNDYEVNARQSLIWGGSFFSTGDDLAVDADIIPYRRRNTVESGFAQCESVQSCGWGEGHGACGRSGLLAFGAAIFKPLNISRPETACFLITQLKFPGLWYSS